MAQRWIFPLQQNVQDTSKTKRSMKCGRCEGLKIQILTNGILVDLESTPWHSQDGLFGYIYVLVQKTIRSLVDEKSLMWIWITMPCLFTQGLNVAFIFDAVSGGTGDRNNQYVFCMLCFVLTSRQTEFGNCWNATATAGERVPFVLAWCFWFIFLPSHLVSYFMSEIKLDIGSPLWPFAQWTHQ